ncbi:MAG: hypothetical protein IPH07_09230 [Deltaproteobacteria bacterium]|nr:hypothetical protein [Deltaproteobacteria bacterium]MBK8236917.1 hypothetical protein [Deltaproteobacteria bacterium]MBP7291127.1 hypothetical protein [Nannocystaceae bacterium]
MKKKHMKLGLRTETVRNLSAATGGITIKTHGPTSTYTAPSDSGAACLPPHTSSTCFSDCGDCTPQTQGP